MSLFLLDYQLRKLFYIINTVGFIFICASHQAGFNIRSSYSEVIEDGEVTHEPKLVRCRSMLVIGSLGAMWTIAKSPGKKSGDLADHRFTGPESLVQCEPMLAFVKSPSMKPGDLANHRFTSPENLVQCKPMLIVVWPPSMLVGWLVGLLGFMTYQPLYVI